ncbi:MAG: crossover junction endodeoxyribonuclease RuvC [Patescibacteria group bacterium]
MLVLGIDPGTATTGFALVKKRGKYFECVHCGTIDTLPSQTISKRLQIINNGLSKIIKEYGPSILAMEKVFFFKNLKTIIPVSQAQGVILLTAAKKNLPVWQLTPIQVKMIITGYGRSKKKQVEEEIKKIIKIAEMPKSDDAVDAIAIAICYLIKKDDPST